jgi:hypothetical protein
MVITNLYTDLQHPHMQLSIYSRSPGTLCLFLFALTLYITLARLEVVELCFLPAGSSY